MRDVDVDPKPLLALPDAQEQGVLLPPDTAPWWDGFEDAQLDALIEAGVSQNLGLLQGLERIQRASAFLKQAGSAGKPALNLGADASRDWEKLLNPPDSSEDEIDIDDALASAGGGAPPEELEAQAPDTEQWETAYDAGLSLRWELDLWGKYRSLKAARREELQASIHDYEALRLALSRQIAETYYAILEQRRRLLLLAEQGGIAATSQQLLELRLLQGDATAVDVLQQRSQVAEIDAERPAVMAALGALENRLDVLLGAMPDGVDRVTLPGKGDALPSMPEPYTVAASLLARRPDLRAAQRRLVANDFEVAAAVADRYPAVTLTGTFSYAGIGGGDRTLGASGGAGLLQPLLDWGQRKAAVMAAEAEFREALYAFSETYLLAIEEVETVLWQEARQRDLVAALEAREAILQRTADEARARYGLGVSDYLPVLTALEQLNAVQRELVAARREATLLRVRALVSAGGGTREATSNPTVTE
ncbi:MAG: hypothetical protein RLZZ303_3415 [Candidatus Hydrogenedentota bacterium]